MKIGAFTLESMTDNELKTLLDNCRTEMVWRGRLKTQRENWVSNYFAKFANTYDAHYIVAGEVTVVAVYDDFAGMRMGKATPVNGDVYDEKVGIAVAFAKAINHKIPEFI